MKKKKKKKQSRKKKQRKGAHLKQVPKTENYNRYLKIIYINTKLQMKPPCENLEHVIDLFVFEIY
jgi:hypothetical protein